MFCPHPKKILPPLSQVPGLGTEKDSCKLCSDKIKHKKILFPAETPSYCRNAVKGIFMTFFFAEKKLILFNLLILK